MIVRSDGNGGLLLITQPDHAALAARIIAACDEAAFAPTPSRDVVLFAIEQHDNGWRELDAAPTLNPDTGRPYDFMTAPLDFKHAIWPRGVERLAATEPLAAALVAQHGLTIHGHRRHDGAWTTFFGQIEALRDRLLHDSGDWNGARREAFERNYGMLYLGDLLSLVFCNQWTEPMEWRGYRAVFVANRVVVAPDPFNGRTVELRVTARAIPDRRYRDNEDLRAAWTAAPLVELTGSAGSGLDLTP